MVGLDGRVRPTCDVRKWSLGGKPLEMSYLSYSWKLRIGIGHPGHKDMVTKHVLGNFKENEKKDLYALFEIIHLNLSQIFVSKHLSNLGI